MDNSENRRILTTQQIRAMEAEKAAKEAEMNKKKAKVEDKKKTSTKKSADSPKPKRHMKKQARRTIAGVIMASAIVVAALPVKEIEASNTKINENADTRTATLDYDAASAASPDIDFPGFTSLDPSGQTTSTSYVVRQLSDGTWSWDWQFKYYVATVAGSDGSSTGAIISEYNSTYPEVAITLNNHAYTDYFTYTTDQFSAFYSTGKGSETHTVTYEEWLDKKSGSSAPNVDWFVKYNKENYDIFAQACQEYYDAKNQYDIDLVNYNNEHAAWVTDHSNWQTKKDAYDAWVAAGSDPATKPEEPGDEPQEPQPPTEPVKPSAINCVPATDFDNDKKCTFICDILHEEGTLHGSGYKLISVADNVTDPTSPVTKFIYMAQGGIPDGDATNDPKGFLVHELSKSILGIASCTYDAEGNPSGSFANISNVKTLTLPEEIKYIGNGAFQNSFIESVTFTNVRDVGNRAFKDCGQLSQVTLDNATTGIGKEAFYNCDKLTRVDFTENMGTVGFGAFADCAKLSTVDMNPITANCDIAPYAFYDDYMLSSFDMGESSGVKNIGEAAFAVSSVPSGGWTDVVLPSQITGAPNNELGDLLFAGRNNIKSVEFPKNYANGTTAIEIPSSMFKGCTNLEKVNFNMGQGSTINSYANFKKDGSGFTYNDLFRDVINPEFKVYGPEFNTSGEKAYPRQSTWQAFTSVSDYVPYVYVDASGVECYEVSDGTYLLQIDDNGTLTSCELVNPSITEIDLVIPQYVGNTKVVSIATDCFSDNVKEKIRSITVEDGGLENLQAGVFKGLPILKWIDIGDSVKAIGDNCFADCPKLEEASIGSGVASIGKEAFTNCPNFTDAYFDTPSVGYENFTIGTDAFKTDSGKLTFHGDIVKGYAPFDFAVGKDTGVIDNQGGRICYKSQSPTFLTCMYDNKTGEVVLLDYPRYTELDDVHKDYCEDREKELTKKYTADTNLNKNAQDDFYRLWVEEIDADGNLKPTAQTLYEDNQYGPFVSDESYERFIKEYYPYDDTDTTNPNNRFYTNPTTVNTALAPDGYWEQYNYSIIDNYEKPGQGDWNSPTNEELAWIGSCINLDIPEGITSLDAYGFFDAVENSKNLNKYFLGSSTLKISHDDHSDEAVPGVLSGKYQDYLDTTSEEAKKYETKIKGNDRVETITLHDIKSLPDYCFDSCERLTTITLGDDLSEMGVSPFRGCANLEIINGNDYFAAENKIIYTALPDGTYSIKECMPSRGNNSDSKISPATDPLIAQVSEIEKGAFEDCDKVVVVDLEKADKLQIVTEDAFNDCDNLQTVYLPSSVNRIEARAFGKNDPITVQIPGIEVDIDTSAFEHTPTNTIKTYEDSAALDYAKYYKMNWEIISNRYKVQFVDSDGTEILTYKDVLEGTAVDEPSPAPTKKDYTFVGWSDDGYKKVLKDVYTIAQWHPNSSNRHVITFYDEDMKTVLYTQECDDGKGVVPPQAPVKEGKTFKAWVPNTFTTGVTKDMEVVAVYESGTKPSPTKAPGPDPTSKPGATPTPTPKSGEEGKAKTYTVSVSGGSGSGSYPAGQVVAITAYDMGTGQNFDRWTTSTAGVAFAGPESPSTFFVMPASNVAITATYKTGGSNGNGGSNGGSNNNGGNNGGNGNNGNSSNNSGSGTTVQVTKGGISNTGVAGATVSGSTDNFVVKVTDDQTASDLALTALQNRFGDISRLKYLPMDISLYDSTGTIKIADTTGISVNLTLPLPDELAPYAGNNRIASCEGGSLEDLNSRFTTVDGVPCISFTASHFSPYVIYVDTANLTEATIDVTPKTGDPIHPKWFLAIGLACVSVILFFKRDKRGTPKAV